MRRWGMLALGGVVAMAVLRGKGGVWLRPVLGRLTSGYGKRIHPITGVMTHHNGCDYAVPEGTVVVAPIGGRVSRVWVDDDYGGGLSVRVSSGAYMVGFAHLSKVLVQEGQEVKRGQVLAQSGNTGRSTGPHLHVTVRYQGQDVDPEGLFGGKSVVA